MGAPGTRGDGRNGLSQPTDPAEGAWNRVAAAGGGRHSSDGGEPNAGLYPAQRNLRYRLDRPMTEEKHAVTYNNFYEFGSQKRISEAA